MAIELDPCDYSVSYENNTEVGTGSVYVTLKGKYVGTISTTFSIVEAEVQKPSKPEEPETDSSSTSSTASSEQELGCSSSVAISAPIACLLLAACACFVKKEEER